MPEIDDAELKTLRAAVASLAKAERERDAFREQLATAQAALTTAQTAHAAELTATKTALERGAALDQAGIADPKVRGWFEGEYSDAAKAAGDKPPTMTEWLAALTPAAAPHLAPWLPKVADPNAPPVPGAPAVIQRPASPTPVSGAGPNAAPLYTPESIAAMSAAEFRAALPAIAKSHPGLVDPGTLAAFATAAPVAPAQ